MRRRGRLSEMSSLFAFQDIMASVIGIVFFVVLIMSMDIVRQGTEADTPDTAFVGATELARLRGAVAARQEHISEITRAIRDLSGRISLRAGGDEELLREVKGLHARLVALYAEIEQRNKTLDDLSARRKTGLEQSQAAEQEVKRLKAQVELMHEQLRTTELSPSVPYIVSDELMDREPWLLDVAGTHLRVASKDGTSAVFDFRAPSADARRRQFLAWVGSQDPQTHYFVILIKPSGVAEAGKLAFELKKQRFHLGTDLLPETWRPF